MALHETPAERLQRHRDHQVELHQVFGGQGGGARAPPTRGARRRCGERCAARSARPSCASSLRAIPFTVFICIRRHSHSHTPPPRGEADEVDRLHGVARIRRHRVGAGDRRHRGDAWRRGVVVTVRAALCVLVEDVVQGAEAGRDGVRLASVQQAGDGRLGRRVVMAVIAPRRGRLGDDVSAVASDLVAG